MTVPVMNSVNSPIMPSLPGVPDNNMINSAMPVAPAISANPAVSVTPAVPTVPAAPVASAIQTAPAAPAVNNLPAQDAFVNSAVPAPATSYIPSATPVAPTEDIWAKEINPGMPAGHAESTPQNMTANQVPAAAQIQQPKQSSGLKKILTIGIIVALGGLAYVKRKELPGIADNISNRLKNIDLKNINLKSLKLDKSPKKMWQDWNSVTTPERLEEYAKECFQTANPRFKQIKIHKTTLKEKQNMSSVIDRVMQIASDAMTADKKGKQPVVHIVLNTTNKDVATKIRELLNKNNVSNFSEKQKILLDKAVEKVELKMESERLLDKLCLGDNRVMINIGYPRPIDTKEHWLNKISSYFTNNIKNKIPKYEN